MPQIQQLPAHIADLIAAGEVVERPASVCKELLENALDAGASAVSVELEHGGMTYLRVTDNGCGIAPEQLPTAFLRHATSKLRTAADLAAIGTLGFRGEALAAISAVSRVDIFTRQTGATAGASLHLEGGVPGQVEETGCPEGTTICVRDLFYNTPARMKFMKKDSAEGAAVSGIVQHLALSHPEVSFKLLRDGAEVLHTPGDGQLLSAVYAAMGRDFALGLEEVRGCGGDVQVAGYVTRPLNGHGTRGRQLFFVNGRFVKSQLLSAALEEAYRNRLLKGKFPGCVLHLTLPEDRVDVNVHPAKTVVKFVSDKTAFDAVYYTVLDALDAAARPKAPEKEEKPFYRTMTAQEFRQQQKPEPEKRPLGSYTARPAAPVSRPAAQPEERPAQTMAVRDVAPEAGKPFTAPTGRPGVSYHITPPAPKPEPVREPVQETVSLPEQVTMEPPREAPWRIAGEVLRTYIICEDAERNVWLIDKHAAHERILFERLKKNPNTYMGQRLLTPLTYRPDQEEAALLLERRALLLELGYEVEDFGGGTLAIRQVPSEISADDAIACLSELAERLKIARPTDSLRDDLLHTIACKAAIKAGWHTEAPERDALVREVLSRDDLKYCPHGRPICMTLRRSQLERQFKRA